MGLCVAMRIPPCRDAIARESMRSVLPALERRRLENRSRWEGK